MFMKSLFALRFAAFLSVGICIAADRTVQPDLQATAMIDDELQALNHFRGGGRVIFGQLHQPPDAKVAARTNLLGDGSFCAAVAAERNLVFMADGYDALAVTDYKPVADNVFDAGVLTFTHAKPEDLRTVKGTLTAADNAGQSPSITCTLQVVNNAYLLEDAGYRGGQPTVDVASQRLSSGQALSFSGLSRIPYRLLITAPGYIAQTMDIDPKQSGVIDLESVALRRGTMVHVSYRARVRKVGGNWIGGDAIKSADVICDGSSGLGFSDQRDGLGNRLELRLRPKDKRIEASFFLYRQNNFHILGVSRLEEISDWDKIDASASKGNYTLMVEEGKVYYLNTNANSTEIQMLFQISPANGKPR